MRRALLVLLLLLGLVVLAGCGKPLASGTVTVKGYTPARDWVYMMPIPHENCVLEGRSDVCNSYFTYLPVPEHDAEFWWVRIRGCDPKCRTRDVRLSQHDYDLLQVGAFYSVPPNK